jgi:RNA polymerase sigma factor (sigma-70 family)
MAQDRFPTTRTSIVAALTSGDGGERSRGFDTLVSVYWRPLYKYARNKHAQPAPNAEDLTQGFLTRLLEHDSLSRFDPAKASFRTFLRLLFDRHIANEWKASVRLKRGGDRTAIDFAAAEDELASEGRNSQTPEEDFEKEWVRSVFALAVDRLRQAAKPGPFALFEAYDLQDEPRETYRDLANRFGLTETTVTNHLASMRREFRKIVLDILREATATEREFRAEARALLGVRL